MAELSIFIHPRSNLGQPGARTAQGRTVSLNFQPGQCLHDIFELAKGKKGKLFQGSLLISQQGTDRRIPFSHVPQPGDSYEVFLLTAPT